MRNVIMYSYKTKSVGARLLRQALGINQIKHAGSTFGWGPAWTVINWGSSQNPHPQFRGLLLNEFNRVGVATNKLSCFRELQNSGVNIPEYTTSPVIARGWLRTGSVCIRHTTTGHGGKGLRIVSTGQERAFDGEGVAPLYTKFLESESEWRVHVFDGRAIHVQKKLRKRGAEGDRRIRNSDNGWVFSSNYAPPMGVREKGIMAVGALGLDFGAVDVVYSGRTAYVLEVNTAPGIEGVSLERYKEAFQNKLGR